jgi:hypothetical protein
LIELNGGNNPEMGKMEGIKCLETSENVDKVVKNIVLQLQEVCDFGNEKLSIFNTLLMLANGLIL